MQFFKTIKISFIKIVTYIVLRFRNEIQAVCAILILTKCLSTIAEAADFNLKNKPENRDRRAVADPFNRLIFTYLFNFFLKGHF